MDFKNEPLSNNFTDVSGLPKLVRLMLEGATRKFYGTDVIEAMNYGGPPGGYDHWLNSRLAKLTPQDVAIMRATGMQMQDILRWHMLKEGRAHIDPYAWPYSDEAAADEMLRRAQSRAR